MASLEHGKPRELNKVSSLSCFTGSATFGGGHRRTHASDKHGAQQMASRLVQILVLDTQQLGSLFLAKISH